jgi:hypothetical protein
MCFGLTSRRNGQPRRQLTAVVSLRAEGRRRCRTPHSLHPDVRDTGDIERDVICRDDHAQNDSSVEPFNRKNKLCRILLDIPVYTARFYFIKASGAVTTPRTRPRAGGRTALRISKRMAGGRGLCNRRVAACSGALRAPGVAAPLAGDRSQLPRGAGVGGRHRAGRLAAPWPGSRRWS